MKYAIYVSKDGEVTGPFTKKELREAVHAGSVFPNDWAWHKKLSEWKPVHCLLPTIYVSRDGEVIAEFDDERELLSGLRDGTLLMKDYYWCEGTAEWKHLFTLEISKAALATEAQKEALRAAGLPFDELTTKAQVSALFANDPNAPATAKQLALLSYLGQLVVDNLTKRKASDLIDAIVGDRDRNEKFRDWNDDKLLLFPEVFADEVAQRKQECLHEYNSVWRKYYARKVTEEQAAKIFAHLDKAKPGWMKPRGGMCIDNFVPCVEAKIHLRPT